MNQNHCPHQAGVRNALFDCTSLTYPGVTYKREGSIKSPMISWDNFWTGIKWIIQKCQQKGSSTHWKTFHLWTIILLDFHRPTYICFQAFDSWVLKYHIFVNCNFKNSAFVCRNLILHHKARALSCLMFFANVRFKSKNVNFSSFCRRRPLLVQSET